MRIYVNNRCVMSVLFEQIYALRDDSQVEGLSRFFKTGPGQYGEGDRFLGIKVPRVREAVKRVWKECTFDLICCI